MDTIKHLIVGLSLALIFYFLLRPTYTLEEQVGSAWLPFETNDSAWLWTPPKGPSGWRYRPDFRSASIYSGATAVIAAASLAGLAFEGKRKPARRKSI